MKNFTRYFLLMVLGVSFSISTSAQYTKDSLFADMQSLLDQKRSQWNVKGLAATLILDDGASWNGVSGIAIGQKDVDTVHKWHWASMSKSVIASVVLQLHEQGVLDINDPLGLYLDADTIPNIDSVTTIKSLLNHTSDFGDAWDVNPGPLRNAVFSNRDSIWNIWDVLDYTPSPISNPSQEHDYKPQINYLLLGFIIEAATGNSLESEIQSRIFSPLNMNNSIVASQGYPTDSMNGIWDGSTSRNNVSQNAYLSTRGGGGALISTSRDLAVFMRNLHQGNLLDTATMAMMYEVTAGAPITGTFGCGSVSVPYGLGTLMPQFVQTNIGDTLQLYGHSGTGNSKGTALHSPDENWTLLVIGNDYSNFGIDAMYFDFVCLLRDNPIVEPVHLEKDEEYRFHMYPNPSKDHVMIQKPKNEEIQIELFDRMGKKIEIESYDLGQEIQLDVSPISPGIYFVKLVGENGFFSKPLIIE